MDYFSTTIRSEMPKPTDRNLTALQTLLEKEIGDGRDDCTNDAVLAVPPVVDDIPEVMCYSEQQMKTFMGNEPPKQSREIPFRSGYITVPLGTVIVKRRFPILKYRVKYLWSDGRVNLYPLGFLSVLVFRWWDFDLMPVEVLRDYVLGKGEPELLEKFNGK